MRPVRDNEDIEVRAAGWILQRDRGELNADTRAELESWLSVDARHREVYLRLDEAWRLSAGLKSWRPVDGRVDVKLLSGEPPPWPAGRGPRVVALAASVLLAVVALVYFWNRDAHGPTYSTQVGGYQRVLLEDGSVLQLNTDTQARVKFTSARRGVELLRGEAYFVVARDAKRSFEVTAANKAVRALGTAFTVRVRDNDALDVIVSEGKVAVTSVSTARIGNAATSMPAPAATLTAGQSAEASAEGVRVVRVEPTEISRRLAWQAGELRFQNQPLAEVVAEFNRYNRRRMEIVDPKLAAVKVGGNFKPNDLESFVAAMRGTLGMEVEETSDAIRLK